MEPEQTAADTHHAFHALHLTAEELAQLSPDELLQTCLEHHRLLQTIMGILTTPEASLTMRVVAIDLLFAQALQISQGKTPEEATQVVSIKQVSERLGVRPHEVRSLRADRGAGRSAYHRQTFPTATATTEAPSLRHATEGSAVSQTRWF